MVFKVGLNTDKIVLQLTVLLATKSIVKLNLNSAEKLHYANLSLSFHSVSWH